MTAIAVSSFSLRQQLGPLRLGYVGSDGIEQEHVVPYPATIGFGAFARRVREELGVDEIELCQIQLGPLAALEAGGAEALRAELDAAGVRVRNVPVDIGDLGGASAERRAAGRRATIRWLKVAAALGARFVRVNAGAPIGGEPDRGILIGELSALAEESRALGIRLLVENHGGVSSQPGFLLGLQNELGAERLGILLDLGNFEPMLSIAQAAFTGAPPPAGVPDFAPQHAAIRALAPHADLVHAKSYGTDAAGHSSPFDARVALEALAEAGFAGPVSIEYEGEHGDPWLWTARTVALTREVLGG